MLGARERGGRETAGPFLHGKGVINRQLKCGIREHVVWAQQAARGRPAGDREGNVSDGPTWTSHDFSRV